ncbi:hypothetical protein LL946_18825 [Knoellia locipacati]|uniref:hypothetical protein n=1 Tax=Knoellia locipacati TaxID=882824 RepID=UPI00385109A6
MLVRRLPFLLPGAVALVLGLDAGLQLLDVPAVPVSTRLPDVHGMLLVLGFVGTLVAVERAVALRRRPGHIAPALLGAGGLLVVPPTTARLGQSLLVAGSVALALVHVALWKRRRDDAVVVQALGAVLAAGAALLWLGSVPVPRLLPWLVGFVVLTIAGERLELARIDLARDEPVLLAGVGLALSTPATLLWPAVGQPVFGLVLLGLVGWLATHDVARRTVRSTGLPRFAAACLLAGYAWLTVAAGVLVLAGPVLDGPAYDALVHTVFLGFTMSMVMAHAPVILPAVLRVPLPYRSALYGPAALLQVSLLVRVAGGDARGWEPALRIGGALNVGAVLGLVGVLIWSAVSGRGRRGVSDRDDEPVPATGPPLPPRSTAPLEVVR